MTIEKCPICGSKQYTDRYYTEECWGIVEEHAYCERCGYTIEMAYSEPIVGFYPPLKKGYKNKWNGKYYNKDIRKRKRMKRKYNIKYDSKNLWLSQII